MNNEDRVIEDRSVNLEEPLGHDWEALGLNVLRYFVKHVCCRIVEAHIDAPTVELPADLIEFLDGGPIPASLGYSFWIEPTWLRFCETGSEDPLWVRPFAVEPLATAPGGRYESRWYYGWLTFGWELGFGEQRAHPLTERQLEVPIRATRSVDLEWPFASMGSRANLLCQGDTANLEHLKRLTGEAAPVDPEHVVFHSPVGQRFVSGVLDAEAGIRKRAPDERLLIVEPPAAEIQSEVDRAVLLVALSAGVWGSGSLDVDRIRTVPVDPRSRGPEVLRAEVEQLRVAGSGEGYGAVAATFSAMSSLKLLEAHLAGFDSEDGQDAMLGAVDFAGRSLAMAGAAADDVAATWDALDAAVARSVRLGADSQAI